MVARALRSVIFKKVNPNQVLAQLNSYLNAASPEPVFFLTRMWNDQQKAITYKELREAIQAGFMDEKTLQDWQMDYANFVETNLKPVWHQAMEAANADLMAKHPDYFFDPFTPEVTKWANEHGAKWVTAVADEQRQAIGSLLSKGIMGDFTVDELSRAIRPLVGLNHMQAQANLNHYNLVKKGLMEAGMGADAATRRARDSSLRYAARQHRQRAYTIATTEMAFAYNKGAHEGIIQAQQQNMVGKIHKIWSTADDERVCGICGALDGVTLGMEDDFQFGGKPLYAEQKRIPPAHPRCRCAIAYEEYEPPLYPVEPEPDIIPAWQPGDQTGFVAPPSLPPPAIPPDAQIKNVTHQGRIYLGGTGEMHLYRDIDGQEWLFKPAQSKGGVIEPFRAYVQEAGYKVQHIINPETTIPIRAMKMGAEVGGRVGAMQKRITLGTNQPDLKAWQQTDDFLADDIKQQLQREHTTDWLLANYDSHGGNFVFDDAARLIGVDKEQSFRYIKHASANKMSTSYHPNAVYGETEPIYNTIFRKFANNELDLNLQDTLTHIKRIEAIPDAAYRKIFTQYATHSTTSQAAAENLLDQIVERKAMIRETYREFYSELLEKRTGIKQAFVWADEAAAHLNQPLAAVMHTKTTLSQMGMAELKQLAKTKQIPYYLNMTKTQLVESIADPVAAVQMSAQVKAKLAANAAARKAAIPKAAAPKLKTTNAMMEAEDVFDDLSVIPDGRLGVSIIADKLKLEGLNMTARRINIDGEEFYEFTGKLTGDTWSKTQAALTRVRATWKTIQFEASDRTSAIFDSNDLLRFDMAGKELTDGGVGFELADIGIQNNQRGFEGFFRIRTRITNDGVRDAQNVKNVIQQVGLDDLLVNVDDASMTRLKKMRTIWQHAPEDVEDILKATPSQMDKKIDAVLGKLSIGKADLANMKMENVFDGYSTLVDEGIHKEYEKRGARFLFAGVKNTKDVAAIIKSKGLMSTNKRIHQGFTGNGQSMSSDINTGGSDSVFVRLSTKSAQGVRYDDSFGGGQYRIKIDVKEMDRTDWYAYENDRFGTVRKEEFNFRNPVNEFVRGLQSSYQHNNEMMFRNGIRRERFIGISCENQTLKDDLIRTLRNEGVTEINGIKAIDFIKVETRQ